ncbi:major cardiolipin synthase ClsA [Capnocytophaga cynodegmi]|uniref:cardiolipin synthase n=1 Tax=Capnocytophaga cynodegmi TaxID=28189 RepID=UPI001ACD9F64|nr:cardiolipin synthase [Capnocytophaga cynodegmi]GIM51749.1 major cardiolipin synthase ClsA [Capnocytophaga cynodegmi]
MSFLVFIQIVYIILLIAVCLRIIWDTRSVSKTLAYLLLVIFVPVLGIIFYFSFGINYRRHKIYNKKLEIDQFFRCELETKIEILRKNHLEQPSLSENMEIIRFLSQTEQTFVAPNSSIEILNNGENLFPVLLREMRNAKSHIHIEYYIYENDVIGNQVKEILIEKARQGVEVRFIYDDFGSRSIRKNVIKELKENGVQVFPFHKINFIFFANRINYRNHRKIVVIDGKTSFVGGINVSDKYINSAENELYWRDTHLMIKGVTSLSLQMVFLSDWNFCSNENITIQPTYFPTDFSNLPKNYYAQIAYSGPDSDLPTILYTTIQAIYSAKEEILLTTPYYIPDTSLQEALIIASLSGISVKLLLPKEGDSFLVNITSQSFLEELLRAGVKIYLYKKGFVHSKTFVIDGKWASVGTANLDARSFDLNFEVSALIYNQDIALQLRETFHKDLLDSEILTLEKWEKRPKYKQLAEKILRLTSPFM